MVALEHRVRQPRLTGYISVTGDNILSRFLTSQGVIEGKVGKRWHRRCWIPGVTAAHTSSSGAGCASIWSIPSAGPTTPPSRLARRLRQSDFLGRPGRHRRQRRDGHFAISGYLRSRQSSPGGRRGQASERVLELIFGAVAREEPPPGAAIDELNTLLAEATVRRRLSGLLALVVGQGRGTGTAHGVRCLRRRRSAGRWRPHRLGYCSACNWLFYDTTPQTAVVAGATWPTAVVVDKARSYYRRTTGSCATR